MLKKVIFTLAFIGCLGTPIQAQEVYSLKELLEIAVANYSSIKAKELYRSASIESVKLAKRTNLPNLNLGAQQTYGSVNGQVGPMYGFGGLGVASSGLPLPDQNWNSGFGALYLVNINWEIFTFGKVRERVNLANSVVNQDNENLSQEVFQHKIRVTAAYINLLAAKKLTYSYLKNSERTETVKKTIETKTTNGLIPEVELSMAKAEHANALIALTRAKDQEQELENKLSLLLGKSNTKIKVDTNLLAHPPLFFLTESTQSIHSHPQLSFLKSKINFSNQQTRFLKTQYYPSFSLVGVFQTRGSSFGSGYASNQNDFTANYFTGITPTRSNYLLGIGVTWNLTQSYRLAKQVSSQNLISRALLHEYELAEQQLEAEQELSTNKWKNAIAVYEQVPAQLQAATDAYTQRSALYHNGLIDLVDLSQAIYALVRAETERDIAISNLWNALLLQAAASGDFNILLNRL